MRLGGAILCGSAVLAVAACAGEQGKLEIRTNPTALAQGAHSVPFRIAEARGQLLIGNVALALESFRKALRDDPASVHALAGIAECYDRMGRYDLSRKNYEAALALAPTDAQLLGALAHSLDKQGRNEEAGVIRREIAERLAVAASPASSEAPVLMAAVPAPVPAVPQQLKPAAEQPKPAVQQQPIARRPVAEAPVVVAEVVILPAAPLSLPAIEIAAAERAVAPARLAEAAPPSAPAPVSMANAAEPARSVTIKLPPPRPATEPVEAVDLAQVPEAPAEVPPPHEATIGVPAAVAQRPSAQHRIIAKANSRATGPRLERLSMGEVALVTATGPLWRAEPVSQSQRSTTVRFVPIRPSTAMAEVRLLNAARVHRLAARTRAYLRGRGWRSISIGDAESTRARSIIYYPAGQRALARRLSVQFGFAIAPHRQVEQVTVLLGRDSFRVAGARAGA